jgi:hypothetical protein
MSSVGSVLLVAVPAVLGSSVVSSLITVYATQSRERREARAEVRSAMRAAQVAAVAESSGTQMRTLADEFARVAMLARLPMPLVDLYVVAVTKLWSVQHPLCGPQPPVGGPVAMVEGEAFSLLVSSTWHPYRSRLRVWWRTRRYRRILVGAVPELDRHYLHPRSQRRKWERELLGKERTERRTRRTGSRPESSSLPSSML